MGRHRRPGALERYLPRAYSGEATNPAIPESALNQVHMGRHRLPGALEGRQRAVPVLHTGPVPGVPAADHRQGGPVDPAGLEGALPAALGVVLLRLCAVDIGAQSSFGLYACRNLQL
jgi:hypothetical protein